VRKRGVAAEVAEFLDEGDAAPDLLPPPA
jgi:hypothetical protein